MISLVVAIGQWLWHLLESAVERVEIWFLTRQWELAPAGIPACLVAAVLLFIVLGQRSKPAVAVAEPYRQAFHAALDAKDYGRAELFLRKLNDLNVVDDRSRFQFALLAQASGRVEAAVEQVAVLAPEDQVGYPPAHLWLAVHDLRQVANWTGQDRRRCIHHLASAKVDVALKQHASELLGVLYLLGQDYSAAAEELKSISNPTLNVRVALACSLQSAGRPDDARAAWSGVVSVSERQLAAAPHLVDIRLMLAIAHSHLGQNDQATHVLRDGLRQDSKAPDPRLQEALGLALIKGLNSSLSVPENTVERQRLLQELVDLAPGSPAIALRLLRWPAKDADGSQRIREELVDRAERDGPGSSALNSVLGTNAADLGELVTARKHLERAYEQDPKNPLILNNLAWVLAKSEPPQLDKALELANSAVQLLPENAEIRETRGQILASRGQWQAAIQDLEWALPKVKSESLPALHATLAEAYDQLGTAERADHHRQQARALNQAK